MMAMLRPNLVEVHLHGLGVGLRQYESGSGAAARADGSKETGILVAPAGRQAWAGTGPGPDARADVFLSQPGFILEADLDRHRLGQMASVCCERAREVFRMLPGQVDPGPDAAGVRR